MQIPFTKRTLANGLDVIVHEDRHAPIVAVNVWYHVGSKNERPGRTGFAHLFEHLMFEGSAHQPRGYFEPLQEVGAALNGSTSADRTNYWEVVPRGALRLALWMEADRMGWLLPAVTETRFNTQRDVVLNERRQNYENRPYGLAQFIIAAALVPPDHPYHWPTIGDPADIERASLDDVRAFFRTYYHPANASLTVAGDVHADDVLGEIEACFGDIPPGPAAGRVAAPRPHAEPLRLVHEDRVELARLYLSWPSPPLFAADDAELDLVGELLANGRSSRLYRRLIHDRRIATELAAHQGSRELAGAFQIVATAAAGHALEEILDAIVEETARFADEGPTAAEVARGRVRVETAFAHRLETLGGFGGRADQLNAYNVYRGDPDGFAGDLGRYIEADTRALADACRRWIATPPIVALSVVPAGRADLALPGSRPASEGVR